MDRNRKQCRPGFNAKITTSAIKKMYPDPYNNLLSNFVNTKTQKEK